MTGARSFQRLGRFAAVMILSAGSLDVALGSGLRAQGAVPSRAMTSAIASARALLDRGDGEASRVLLDSLVRASPEGSVDLAEALYHRAVTSETIADAERDWKRMLIEIPLADRTSDALVRLAELDALRGHHAEVRRYVDRLLLDHAKSPNRPRALLLRAQAWFAENQIANGCLALGELRGALPAGATELELQSNELAPRCVVAAAGTPSVATPPKTVPTTVTAASTPPPTPPATKSETTTGRFSVQLAAYARRNDAEAFVKRLATLGIDARVDGTEKPFRVRTGRYATQAEAAARLAELKKQGHDGFIAEITP